MPREDTRCARCGGWAWVVLSGRAWYETGCDESKWCQCAVPQPPAPVLTPTESARHQLDTRRLAVEESRAERFAADPQGCREIGAGRQTQKETNVKIIVSYATGFQPESLLDLISGDRCSRDGYLTTEHAASSHGLPVLVDAITGAALGPAECGEITASTYVSTDDASGRDINRALTSDETALIDAARRAGYAVRTPEPR